MYTKGDKIRGYDHLFDNNDSNSHMGNNDINLDIANNESNSDTGQQ